MANFTRGPVDVYINWIGKFNWDGTQEVVCLISDYVKMEDKALIALAFNSATKVEEMGFDGQKAIEELPNIVGALLECEVLLDNYPLIRRMVKDTLVKIKEKSNG